MIHKIQLLASIGKFRDYQASGDVTFKELTLFYGDNGGGKTTLSTIFRSLTQNDPELIRRRISTNPSLSQAAHIIQRNNTVDIHHNFNASRGWSNSFHDIEIFDIHFINENIYSGFDFSDEHKKHLHQFVIGAQGVAIQRHISQNKVQKASSKQTQNNFVQQLIQQVGNNLDSGMINSFIALKTEESINIDNNIEKAESALASANANSVIQTLQRISPLPKINISIDLASLETDLQTTSQTIQSFALKSLFEQHCNDLSDNAVEGAEKWLKTGYSYLESKQLNLSGTSDESFFCPFCKQKVDDTIDVIKAYTLKFNSDFNSLVTRIDDHLRSSGSFNIDAILQAQNNIDQTNKNLINSWSQYLPSTLQKPDFKKIADETKLEPEFQALVSAIRTKQQNPSVAVKNDYVTAFQTTLQNINTNIDAYNQSVVTYNSAIVAFLAGIQTVAQARSELERLKRIKKRFEAPISTLCNQLTAEKQNLRTLESAYTQLMQIQKSTASTFFSSYKSRVNYYLNNVFKTLYKIDDLVHIPPQGRATQSKIGYKLTIDNEDISFDPNQPNSAKDCLSEGDKSTIALAFFLSKLDIDPNLQNKILIFDDPLSSFDSNRRMYTVQLIKNLLPNIKQIVVLSHNEFFLYELSKGIRAGDKKTLRITEDFIAKASSIEPLFLEKLVENDYFKHIKELEQFLRNPDLSKKDIVLGWMRNVLEAHIRFKFFRQLSGIPSNNQTFGRLIKELDDQNVPFRDDANRQSIISDLYLINGISCKPHHGEPVPDYVSLGVNPSTINVAELANFITDTFDLVDNKL